MSDDEILDALGTRARQRWSEQTAALDAESVEGWTPLTDSEQQDVVAGVLAQLGDAPSSDASEESAAPVPIHGRPVEHVPEPAANEPPGRSRWLAAAGAVLAVAAAVVIWRGTAPSIEALPTYEDAGFEGGTAIVRGDAPEAEVPRLLPDGELRWRLRPSTAVEGTVRMHLWADGAQPRCIAVGDALRVSGQGALEVQGRVADVLPLPPGEWVLTPIIGRAEAFAGLEDPCAWRAQGTAAPDGVIAGGSRTIRIDPPAP